MNKFLLIALLGISACTSRTDYGHCIGLNDEQDSGLVYKYNAWNIGVAIALSSLIVPPLVVILDEYKCPIGVK